MRLTACACFLKRTCINGALAGVLLGWGFGDALEWRIFYGAAELTALAADKDVSVEALFELQDMLWRCKVEICT